MADSGPGRPAAQPSGEKVRRRAGRAGGSGLAAERLAAVGSRATLLLLAPSTGARSSLGFAVLATSPLAVSGRGERRVDAEAMAVRDRQGPLDAFQVHPGMDLRVLPPEAAEAPGEGPGAGQGVPGSTLATEAPRWWVTPLESCSIRPMVFFTDIRGFAVTGKTLRISFCLGISTGIPGMPQSSCRAMPVGRLAVREVKLDMRS